MGDERSSTWPTVIEVAVTPGERPVPPEPLRPDVGGATPESREDVGGDLEEQEASPTASTHRPARSATRGLTLPTLVSAARERVGARFSSTLLPSASPS